MNIYASPLGGLSWRLAWVFTDLPLVVRFETIRKFAINL
jgi:hypothetical protein